MSRLIVSGPVHKIKGHTILAGDALDTGATTDTFDAAVQVHVGMNIENKELLALEHTFTDGFEASELIQVRSQRTDTLN